MSTDCTDLDGGGAQRRVPHRVLPATRRDFLLRSSGGFGALALLHLLESERAAAFDGATSNEAGAGSAAATASSIARAAHPASHHVARAQSVIFVFLEGGPSHLDLFDPKPELEKLAGKPLPESVPQVITAMGEFRSPVLPSRRQWRRCGQGGLWISDWLPRIAQHADDLLVVRSLWADGLNHVGSVSQMNTGSTLAGRPSLGSWIHYGLGATTQNLPAFVVLLDRPGTVAGGQRNWGNAFLPATYQGTQVRSSGDPIPFLSPPQGSSLERQRIKLDLIDELNRRHLAQRSRDSELEARIHSYELAFRMQAEAPEAVDISRETARTNALYGIDDAATADLGRACLRARRLVERGVRFVQVYSGAGAAWDAHSDIEGNHGKMCRSMDGPVAGLLADLKQRGLLDSTLVIWGGEFGRTPMSEKGDGRDHNPTGFTMWLAGAGLRGGRTVGATDEFGLHAVEDRVHVLDFHATLLHLLGLDHRRLSYLQGGRLENVTINEGQVVEKISS